MSGGGATAGTNLAIRALRAKFEKEYRYGSDNKGKKGKKGHSGVYPLKAAIEKLDRKAVATAMHPLKVSTVKEPGILMDVSFDRNGDLDRENFLVEVKNGQLVIATLPPLGAPAAK